MFTAITNPCDANASPRAVATATLSSALPLNHLLKSTTGTAYFFPPFPFFFSGDGGGGAACSQLETSVCGSCVVAWIWLLKWTAIAIVTQRTVRGGTVRMDGNVRRQNRGDGSRCSHMAQCLTQWSRVEHELWRSRVLEIF